MSFLLNTCDAEYSKNSKINKDDVLQLMDWVEKQSHMPKVSEYILIQMLHVCDYSIQRAKDLAETYYEYRTTASELFLDDSAGRTSCSCDFWSTIYCFLIPKPTTDGYRILYFALRQYDTTNFNNETVIRMYVRMLITLIMDVGICAGYKIIYDLKGYSFAHIAGLNLSIMKKYICFSQEAIPLRVKSVYIINGGALIEKLNRIIRPFIKKETADMVGFYSNIEDVYKIFGKEHIPSDLGGTLPETREELNGFKFPIAPNKYFVNCQLITSKDKISPVKSTGIKMKRKKHYEKMKAKVNALSPIITEELNLKIDESKRLTKKSNNISCMDGGSFRKLEVD